MWKLLPNRYVLKTKRKLERESPKRTISASGGRGPLQMILELDIERCVNEEAKPRRGWTRGDVSTRMLGLEKKVYWRSFTSIEEGTSVSEDA